MTISIAALFDGRKDEIMVFSILSCSSGRDKRHIPKIRQSLSGGPNRRRGGHYVPVTTVAIRNVGSRIDSTMNSITIAIAIMSAGSIVAVSRVIAVSASAS